MIISELIKRATRNFENAGIDTPKLDAIILLENVLEKERSYLIANSEREISEKQEKAFDKLVSRRLKREPVAQIIGKKEFFGREFKVSTEVLTPRPETEIIIETALKIFPHDAKINILDLGTGTGCILLTLLAELPNARGLGVDISKTALAMAKKNAYNLGVENVEFINSDWCNNLGTQQKFQLIVSNPPYIPMPEKTNLEADLSFEPETALFGGNDGLDCYRRLASDISKLDFDYAIFEIGINQEEQIKEIFKGYQISLKEVVKDLAGINRTMVFKK